MKKLYSFLLVLSMVLVISNQLKAQGIHQFWGITRYGGDQDQGVLFSAKSNGTGLKTREAFKITTPDAESGFKGFAAVNNKLYGFFVNAGFYDEGILFEFDPATNKYTQKLDLYKSGISSNKGFLYQFNNKLFGIATHDGESKLYEYDPLTNTITIRSTIDYSLIGFTWYNNRFYGTAYLGGAFDDGYIFSYNPVTYTVTKLLDVPDNTGPVRGFTIYNNKLYGTADLGGDWGYGAVIEFNPATNQLTEKASLSDADGRDANSGLTLFAGKMYGTTLKGGVSDLGVLYEYNPALNTITKKLDITATTAMRGFAGTYNNKLYGVVEKGGVNNGGKVYEYDPATNTYTNKVFFFPNTGTNPYPEAIMMNNKIYGINLDGGSFNSGTVFEYNPATNGIAVKLNLGESNGHHAYGKMVYFQGKLYGFTTKGGNNNLGVIYSYDLATHQYAVRYHMSEATGVGFLNGSMVVFNNKLYGVTYRSEPGGGVLFEFNPANDQYVVKHTFGGSNGAVPMGRLLLYKNKFYSTTSAGGNTGDGVLYEYDPVANTYAVKVHFGNAFGITPYAPLVMYKDKLYGTCTGGGASNGGTLFEYNPDVNGFSVKYNFVENQASTSTSALVVLNDKLYGTTDFGDLQNVFGTLFEYNPATGTVTNKHNFTYPEGSLPRNEMHVYNNKLYGIASGGGGVITYGGVLYEYDPVPNKWTSKTVFTGENGRFPFYSGMTVVPALVAPGTPGTCAPANAALINTTNATDWIPFTDAEGNAVMEINANGNLLGSVRVEFYTHDGETRKDQANRFYLDRNITVTVENQPATPVSIRLYIKKTEFDKLKNTAGSGVLNVSDITLFKNDDPCSKAVDKTASPIASTVTTWGLDYVYTAQVSSFSSFYFASKGYTALPVKLEYFKGNAEATVNRLHWKASCTENTDFIVERSADGHQFKQIGMVMATAEDCGNPFMFPDQQPLNGKNFYRLQMKEQSGTITYSSIISIDRSGSQQLEVLLSNNPVQGSTANFMVQSPQQMIIPVTVYDATGRLVARSQWTISKGSQLKQLELPQLPKGVYTVVFQAKEKLAPVRFIKQ